MKQPSSVSLSDKRKDYMRGAYSKYWMKARTETYGVMDYDLSLIELIDNTLKSDKERLLLDVGIGTGYPIASSLAALNYDISGVDISSRLIKKCLEDNPDIHAVVGDAENMTYEADSFDLVYCLHSSWLMPNFLKALSSMFRVTRENGFILIDIMNINNQGINKIYQQHIFENNNVVGKLFKTFKNLAKFILRSGTQDWPFLISWSPSDPGEIIDKCLSFGGEVRLYSWLDGSLIQLPVSKGDTYKDHSRIVLSCKI